MTKHHCIVWHCVVLGLLQNVVDLQAQGTTFFSNLGQTPTGNSAIATDSWYAEEFITGTNAGGYVLNSVQLRMASPTGSPLGFSVSVYQGIIPPFGSNDAPGTYLQSLSGNDPATSGVFTFQSPGLLLSPFTVYFVVTAATTSMTSGAFNWSKTTGNFTPAGHDPWAVAEFYTNLQMGYLGKECGQIYSN